MLVGRDRAQMRTNFVVGARPAGWFVSCVVTLCCQFSVAIGVDKKSIPKHVSASSGYFSTDVRR